MGTVKYIECEDVAFVQVALRITKCKWECRAIRGGLRSLAEISYVMVTHEYAYTYTANKFDTDPLSNRNLLLYDIINVGRDGVGGAMAKQHGCMYRIDVLKQGKDARGQTVVPEEDVKEYLGKGIGFSTLAVSLSKRNRYILIGCFKHIHILIQI